MRIGLTMAGLFLSLSAMAEQPFAKFGWFAQVIGSCWVGDFPDGKTRHSHCYTMQFDKFIRGTATLSAELDGQWVDQFSGDSMFTWNETEKRINFYSWGSDGNHAVNAAYYEGDELMFPVRSRKDPAKIAFRSVWRRIDDSSFEVRREVPDGAGWKTDLTVLYRRATPAN